MKCNNIYILMSDAARCPIADETLKAIDVLFNRTDFASIVCY
jgi:hypothetical protein